jgi:hypothetical protein
VIRVLHLGWALAQAVENLLDEVFGESVVFGK